MKKQKFDRKLRLKINRMKSTYDNYDSNESRAFRFLVDVLKDFNLVRADPDVHSGVMIVENKKTKKRTWIFYDREFILKEHRHEFNYCLEGSKATKFYFDLIKHISHVFFMYRFAEQFILEKHD